MEWVVVELIRTTVHSISTNYPFPLFSIHSISQYHSPLSPLVPRLLVRHEAIGFAFATLVIVPVLVAGAFKANIQMKTCLHEGTKDVNHLWKIRGLTEYTVTVVAVARIEHEVIHLAIKLQLKLQRALCRTSSVWSALHRLCWWYLQEHPHQDLE